MSRRQPNLFANFAVPARADSAPQVQAAEVVRPHAGKQAKRILQALVMLGPMTREELHDATGIPHCALCGRLRELECPEGRRHALLAAAPMVKKVGRRRARSGVRVWLYEITEAGKKSL